MARFALLGSERVYQRCIRSGTTLALGCGHCRDPNAGSLPSPVSVNVASMVDSEDGHLAGFVVDSIQDAIGATSSTVDAREFVAELASDALRVLDQCAGDEIDNGGTHRLGELLGDRSRCWAGHDEFVALLGHCVVGGRSARTASTPRTTSPDATAASALTRSLTASASLRSSRVSSKLSRSSGLIRTAAGRPLRVTTTRSCSRSTRSTNSENRSFTLRRESVVTATIVPRSQLGRNSPGHDRESDVAPRSAMYHRCINPGSTGLCRSVRVCTELCAHHPS